MVPARVPDTLDFSRRISIETPEHVILRFELAGLGSRAAAAVFDYLFLSLVLFALLIAYLLLVPWSLTAVAGEGAFAWIAAGMLLLYLVVTWGYFALFEAFAQGRTPGKRRVGIRVVMDTGHPVTFHAAMIRNLLRLVVDAQPGTSHLVGLLFAAFDPQHKRLGDVVAGTIVVRDRPEDFALAESDTGVPETIDAGPPRLADDEFRLLDQFMARYVDLPAEVRNRFAAELADRFAERFPDRHPRPGTFVSRLHRDEQARRRARTAVRRTADGTAAGGSADRFVALRQPAWEGFRARAGEVERKGLKTLSGDELAGFAAEYRRVAADLARARTYGVDPRVLAYLERVVSTGHNALYGLRGVTRLPLGRLLLRELPAAVYRARRHVVVAGLIFVLPGVAGYALVRERPQTAYDILPDEMIARAETGEYRRAEGRGYAEAPSPYLPIVASAIVANNVQVAFGAFAFGVTAGVGTVLLLLFNGLFFGAVMGLFANYQLADWILTFVAAHGVLELMAIFIAGGAGLLIAQALIAPGDLARRDALVLHGRAAVRMLGAAVCLLVVAGAIEGFISARAAPASLKLGVSAASAAALALYLALGRRAARRAERGLLTEKRGAKAGVAADRV